MTTEQELTALAELSVRRCHEREPACILARAYLTLKAERDALQAQVEHPPASPVPPSAVKGPQ